MTRYTRCPALIVPLNLVLILSTFMSPDVAQAAERKVLAEQFTDTF